MQEFSETQRPPRGLVVLAIGIVMIADIAALAGTPAGPKPWLVALTLVPVALVAALMAGIRMQTRVDARGLHVRMLGLVQRSFAFRDIASAQAVKYRPIWQYGGWGIRWSRRGRAYNMRGNRGVQLVLTSGKCVLIGSQWAETLAAALHGAGVPH